MRSPDRARHVAEQFGYTRARALDQPTVHSSLSKASDDYKVSPCPRQPQLVLLSAGFAASGLSGSLENVDQTDASAAYHVA